MDKKTAFVLIFLGLILLFSVIVYSAKNSKTIIDCQINNISYVNLTGGNLCYIGFSEEYCPMPKDIHCTLQGDLFGFILVVLESKL